MTERQDETEFCKDIKPFVKANQIITQELGDELLIYDLETNKAHSLNKTAAEIWNNCDGTRSSAEIASEVSVKMKKKVIEDVVWLALDQFDREGLLEGMPLVRKDYEKLSRREVIKKIGITSLVALPIVSTIIAPKAASAQSPVQCGGAPVCIPPNNDLCAGCNGTNITIDLHTTTNGSCSGVVIQTINQSCNGVATIGVDATRS